MQREKKMNMLMINSYNNLPKTTIVIYYSNFSDFYKTISSPRSAPLRRSISLVLRVPYSIW